ncbi:MAG: YebC/PmpR family DNA-binding transcriptional regulator [Candidatus Stygibacter australis]|nr:YebC/PmpR family DNA-binding transcriptional regulator [Candidatus Stygibacter australis]MDP8321310.1 YebC/PmpR family DNA-binding transcriptional regulator [Candidatus Stygibacter australis]
MSGHNKWSSIKHKKGAADAKRGRIFTKYIKDITVAAREGGGDVDSNPSLRVAISGAKSVNMPAVNIERAIKKGTGELEGVNYEECTYEGYGHNGIAILVETLTDNKQRTVSEVRHAFSKYGGNLAESGAVAWMFNRMGMIVVKNPGKDEDEVMMDALEAGADDVEIEEDSITIYTPYTELHSVMLALESNEYEVEKAELTMIPKNVINADNIAEKLFKLLDWLEDLDDVQKVYANYEISDEVFERLSAE